MCVVCVWVGEGGWDEKGRLEATYRLGTISDWGDFDRQFFCMLQCVAVSR